MMRIGHAVCALLVCTAVSRSDERPYAVARIPDSLRRDAAAVVRTWTQTFRVKNISRATHTVRRAVTIFSSRGRSWGEFYQLYDKFHTLEELDGAVYDAEGRQLRTLEEKDIRDYSAISDYSLFEDDRVRIATLSHDRYPYTVEYEYEVEYRGSLQWPAWIAQPTEDAVEQAEFTVDAPEDAGLRFWCNRDSLRPELTADDDRIVRRWKVSGLPRIPSDVVGHLEDVSPIVRIAPTEFEMEKRRGRMDTWEDFGRWVESLRTGRDALPAERIRLVQRLVDGIAEPRARAAALYRQLQSEMRYVSIQLGIGGWQPLDAAYVSERKYGDCKALSNYMVAILKAAGMTAYPAAIYSGSRPRPMITEFPSAQFNHMVVCLPLTPDTLWLECTSRTLPFGRLSADCSDRPALLLTPEGGRIVEVPLLRADENIQSRSARVSIRWDGSGEVACRTAYTGYQQDRIRSATMEETVEARREWILNRIPASTPVLRSYAIDSPSPTADSIVVDVRFEAPKLAVTSGSRLFLIPNLFERTASIPEKVAQRRSPVRLPYPFVDRDSMVIRYPERMQVEALPSPVELDGPYASYSSRTERLGDTALVYTRRLERKTRIIPAEAYEEHRAFMTAVVKADKAQAVLVQR